MTEPADVVELFLTGARTIASAVADPSVAASWDNPSVLESQLVSSLAGHLARGGVWAVSDYLRGGVPPGPIDFDSAGQYFASFVTTSTAKDHRAIRERGAAVAAVGRDALLDELRSRLETLETDLPALEHDLLIAVIAGKVMRLGDYLTTRIVEQAVHLDDLARSAGRAPWPLPEEHLALTVSVGVDIARRLHGFDGVIRALYRREFAETVFPVL